MIAEQTTTGAKSAKGAIKPLSEEGVQTIRALEQAANSMGGFATLQRRYLDPLNVDSSIMSRLRRITPETPGGIYTGSTPRYEEILKGALRKIEADRRNASPVPLSASRVLELPRFQQIFSGIERNALCTDKRRGAAYIGGTGAGKSVLCHHVAAKFREAKNPKGEPLFNDVLRICCSSAWRSEQSIYEILAARLQCSGGPWRNLLGVQTAVTDEIVRRGSVFFVVDEFQVLTNGVFRFFMWLENNTLARWFVAGDDVVFDRMTKSCKLLPNAEQFEARTLPIHRVQTLGIDDVTPFLRSYQEAGATVHGDFNEVALRVAEHASDFGLFNLIADTLPKYVMRDHRNRWSVETVDAAVAEVKRLHGRTTETKKQTKVK